MNNPCPYCQSQTVVKRGLRRKKLERVQLYLCRNPQCGRTFTAQLVKGKRYPMALVAEGLSYYHLGFGLGEVCKLLQQKFGLKKPPSISALGSWAAQYAQLCRFSRLRPYALKLYRPAEMVEVTSMAHRQIYRFRYHRAKMALALQEYKHRYFRPLKDYLDAVSTDTPHQYFQDSTRMSEAKAKFDKSQMVVKGKENYANSLARFALQGVRQNKFRHEAIQRFFIANDSVTVATEVPVYIRREDIEHMQNKLDFQIAADLDKFKNKDGKVLLTGHVDLVQVRNGVIHLLDYKPKAEKEKPIEQLTWYALAMSRLTGLRLREFKCAWFDDRRYFEFYPLHVVKKLRNPKKKKIYYKDGRTVEIPL
ncbi:MAG: PD-(D/E)XK nuclease family protein, partial [Patescibacteria group bacterium]